MSFGKKSINFFTSKAFWINLLAIVLFWIVLIWGTIRYLNAYTSFGEKIEVPTLINNNVKDLPQLLQGYPLRYEIVDSIYNPNLIEGTVIYQEPKPTDSSGLFVKSDRLIKLRVSKQTRLVEVPLVVNRSRRYAETALKIQGFRTKTNFVPSIEEQGSVIRQIYKGKPVQRGTKLPINSLIEIEVGMISGNELVLVPNLKGLTIKEAKERLSNTNGLKVFAVCNDCLNSADSLNARVINQNPTAMDSSKVVAGSTITVFASTDNNLLDE